MQSLGERSSILHHHCPLCTARGYIAAAQKHIALAVRDILSRQTLHCFVFGSSLCSYSFSELVAAGFEH